MRSQRRTRRQEVSLQEESEEESEEKSEEAGSSSSSRVNVVVRVRPPLQREREKQLLEYNTKCVSVEALGRSLTLFQPLSPSATNSAISPKQPLSPPPLIPRTFTFDYVADESVNQEEMFVSVGRPMAHACLQGYHCCLIAYGQTGAGKTYTMEGQVQLLSAHISKLEDPSYSNVTQECGLIPRILETIFLILDAEKEQSDTAVDFSVRCSSLQIYNEQVEDLLCPGSTNLTIHEDPKTGMYVEGLQEVEVQTPEATYEVLKQGSLNRNVGATAMNSESSRSHGVFILSLESQRHDLGVLNRRISRFYMVDLAGSERQKQTEAVGLRLKESGSINRSLSALGNVIKALLETSEGKIRHIPYRDSKLTYLLKDALGGNSKCTLIANISPSMLNVEETLSTLKFAQRAKLIKNVATINEDIVGNGVASAEEVKKLRLEVATLRTKIGVGDQTGSWSDHTSTNQVRRLEYIVAQSTKQALAGERKTAREMHSLMRKMDALKSMYMRLDRALEGLNASNLQKQRKDATFSASRKRAARDINAPDGEKMHSSDDSMVIESKAPEKTNGKVESNGPVKNLRTLQSQISQLKNLNQTLKLEIENLTKEKNSISVEVSDVTCERDESKQYLASLENENENLKEIIQKLKQEPDKDKKSLDGKERALRNFKNQKLPK